MRIDLLSRGRAIVLLNSLDYEGGGVSCVDITGGGAPISEMSVIYHRAAGTETSSVL